MKKRMLSILLLCCMVLTLLPTAAFAAGELPDVKLSVPTTFDKTVDLTKQNGELKITDSKTYLIKGSADPNWYFQYRIKIDGSNNTPHIFLDGVRLQAPKDGPAIELYGGASACLYFIGGDSELIGAENFAALQKNKTEGYLRVLVQTGTKLTCQGGHHGAGIGGSKVGIKKFSQGHGMNLHFGSLATDIYGGEIFATSGVGGAGIGGGANGGVGEQIYVYSGKLTAISVSQGAGIGGGQGGPGRHIYIRGGTVEAGSRSAGAGIGSGDYAGPGASEDTHDIEISGGRVDAWSNYAGAGIGGGRYSSGHDISIIGGEVTAQGYWGAGIGGGRSGDGWNILIKDAELTAQSVPLYPAPGYEDEAINGSPAVAVGRGSDRSGWATALFNPDLGLWREDNIKIGTSSGKSVRLSATGWQWRRSQGQYEWGWGTTTELLIPNENGRVDLQRLSLPYACNYGRVIGKLELHCEKRACGHEFAWTDRDGCHIWTCVKCGARDPAAENSKQNAKHIPGDWGVQEMRCAVCDHLLEKDTKAPVLEVLKDGESYTVEDNIDGNPGAYTFTVSDPAASGETSSGIKSVTINGEPQDGPTYRLPAPDGGKNDAGAEYTVVATDNAGNETTATVRTYRRHHYTVTFDSTGGSEVIEKTMAVTYGEQLGVMPVPIRMGYFFRGWYDAPVDGKCYGNSDGQSTSQYDKTENCTLYAQWTIKQYTITFDTAGGSEVASITQDYGSAITAPAAPTREGYTFIGWDTAIPATMPAGNITLTAQWQINQYTITFDTAGGSGIAPITQDYGTAIAAPANPTRDGYTFVGWDKEIPETMPPENITITAQWEINQYTITFDTAGGSKIDSITQDYGTAITAPADPIREGYTFIGWDKEIPEAMPAENITITAQWKINQYTITFDTAGGSKIDSITQDYGSAITAPADPTREGYTFTGWDKEIPTTMPAENVTITAQWVVCDHSGSTAQPTCIDSATCTDCGGTIAALGHAAKTGYKSDEDSHWMECERCTAKLSEESHRGGEANCHAKAVCETCNTPYGDLDAENHDGGKAIRDRVPATCTEDGYSGDTYCLGCDTLLATGKKIKADGHKGGKATCTEKAKCEVCNEKYGEPDPSNHSDTTEWIQTESEHTQQYRCCGAVVVQTEEHNWKDGICRKCGYGCEHIGGKATCHTKAICKTCNLEYGEFDGDNHDGDTELRGDIAATCIENGYTGDTYCLGCDKVLATGKEIKAKGHKGGKATCHTKAVCKICKTEYGKLDKDNHDGETELRGDIAATCTENGYTGDTYCLGCDKVLATGKEIKAKGHKGGKATCHTKAVCKICKAEYGKLDKDNHDGDTELRGDIAATCTENGYTGDTYCLGCDKVLVAGKKIKAKGHIGGKATCHTKAVCDICGKGYGKLDPKNHADLKHIDAKPATTKSEGNIEYRYCKGCKKYYKDAAGTKEIKLSDTVIAKIPSDSKNPKTDAHSNFDLWFILMFIGGGTYTVLTIKRRKVR